MTISEGLLLGGVAVGLVCLVVAGGTLIQAIVCRKKARKWRRRRAKTAKKQAHIRRQVVQSTDRSRRLFRWGLVLFLLGGGCLGASGYTVYYQSLHLSAEDSDAVATTYYLVHDFQDQLELAKDPANQAANQETLRYIVTTMASYGTMKASYRNAEEGQLRLNRYYNAVTQLGVNGSLVLTQLYGNETLIEEYLADAANVQTYQEQVFHFYKVDEQVLAEGQ